MNTEDSHLTAETPTPGLALSIHRPNHPPVLMHRGAANIELAIPITENTTFNVGSVAKQMTAHLAILSARNGMVNLNEPVGSLLPRLEITDVSLSDLITHQGGIRDAETLLSLAGFRELDHYTPDDLLDLAYRQTERAVPPGTFLYSNTGYLLLVEALQNLHCCKLEDLAQRFIFAPLGMTSTRFKARPTQVITGAASSYEGGAKHWKNCARPVALPGPGSLWSSTSDLHRWLDYLGKTWKEQGTGLPFGNEISYTPGDQKPYLYGPGIYAYTQPGNGVIFHYGHEHGFSAATILAGTGLRVVCLSNQLNLLADHVASNTLAAIESPSGGDHLEEMLDEIFGASLPESPPESPAPSTSDHGQGHTSLGTYICDQVPGSLRLSSKSGILYLWRRGTQSVLAPIGQARYALDGGTIQLDEGDSQIFSSFIIDLDRAPGLHYRRK